MFSTSDIWKWWGKAIEKAGEDAAEAAEEAAVDFMGLRRPEKSDDPRCPHCRGVRLVPQVVPDTGYWCPHCGRDFEDEEIKASSK